MAMRYPQRSGWSGIATVLAWLMVFIPAGLSHAVFEKRPLQLLTPEEAARPDAPVLRSSTLGGNGPQVEAANLEISEGTKSFRLTVRVSPRSGVPVDAASLRLFCLKEKPVDLTTRVQPFITPVGLAIDQVFLPPGAHRFRVSVADVNGRLTERDFVIKVSMAY